MDRIAIIFANFGDDGMGVLTRERSKASMPFGGRYRLIDFMLSNLVNAGVEKVGIATRGNYQSLMDHVGAGREWDLDKRKGGMYFFPPFVYASSGRHNTKLEALLGARHFLTRSSEEFVFLCEPDVVCNIDLDAAVEAHKASGADITVVAKPFSQVRRKDAVYCAGKVDDSGRIYVFDRNGEYDDTSHISAGIYVLRRKLLLDILSVCEKRHFSSFDIDVLGGMADVYDIRPFDFPGYVSKINTIQQYYESSMELLDGDYRHEIFYANGRVYTKTHDDVPVLYGLSSNVKNSLIADGSSIEGLIENSIIFRRVHVGKNSVIRNCILMQDDEIGDNVTMEHVISDKNVTVRPGTTLRGTPDAPAVISKGETI